MTRDTRQPLASRGVCLTIAVAILLGCGEGSDQQDSSGLSLEQAQALAVDESAPASKRSRALRELSGYLASQGQLREAVAKSEAAVELLAAEPSDGGELATALNELSGLHFQLGDYQRQEEVLWRALELAAATSDRASAASSWNNLGVSYAARGRPSAALAAYQHCLELRRDLEDRVGVAATRHNLGVQLLLLGRVDEGVDELRQAVAVRRAFAPVSPAGTRQFVSSRVRSASSSRPGRTCNCPPFVPPSSVAGKRSIRSWSTCWRRPRSRRRRPRPVPWRLGPWRSPSGGAPVLCSIGWQRQIGHPRARSRGKEFKTKSRNSRPELYSSPRPAVRMALAVGGSPSPRRDPRYAGPASPLSGCKRPPSGPDSRRRPPCPPTSTQSTAIWVRTPSSWLTPWLPIVAGCGVSIGRPSG